MLRPVADDLQALRASLYRWADKVLAARGGEDRLVYVIAMVGLLRAARAVGRAEARGGPSTSITYQPSVKRRTVTTTSPSSILITGVSRIPG